MNKGKVDAWMKQQASTGCGGIFMSGKYDWATRAEKASEALGFAVTAGELKAAKRRFDRRDAREGV